MDWHELDWEVLDRLRDTFLRGDKTQGPYWHTVTDLDCYDFTYAERIGWKWDAVLRELQLRGWTPPASGPVLDWGCGSGVASRRVLEFFGADRCGHLILHDHSALATDYARHRANRRFPGLTIGLADTRMLRGNSAIGLLVISHVLNELDEAARAELAGLIARATAVLWVEPGTHEVSRQLGAWRDRLLAAPALGDAVWQVVAPCTHAAACGLLLPGNERHWCHFFASPPVGIHADSHWVKFGQRAGIDLRSLPYSFLALDRRPWPQPEGVSRILGEPRFYKGFAKLFSCEASGVSELTLQKRVDAALFKHLDRAPGPHLYRWTRESEKIVAAQAMTSS